MSRVWVAPYGKGGSRVFATTSFSFFFCFFFGRRESTRPSSPLRFFSRTSTYTTRQAASLAVHADVFWWCGGKAVAVQNSRFSKVKRIFPRQRMGETRGKRKIEMSAEAPTLAAGSFSFLLFFFSFFSFFSALAAICTSIDTGSRQRNKRLGNAKVMKTKTKQKIVSCIPWHAHVARMSAAC